MISTFARIPELLTVLGELLAVLSVLMVPQQLLLAGGGPGIGVQAQEDLKQRFLREAPKAWEVYRQRANRLQGDIILIISTESPRWQMRREFQVKRCPSAKLWLTQYFPGQPSGNETVQKRKRLERGEVTVSNSKYSFRLRRHAPDSPWFVTEVDTADAHAGRIFDDADMEFNVLAPVTLGWATGGPPPRLGDARLSIAQVAPVESDGRQLVKVEYRYRPEAGPGTPEQGEGWALLDPANGWVVREADLSTTYGAETNGPSHIHAVFEYGRPSNQGLLLLRRTVELSFPSSADAKNVTEYNMREQDVPEREFTLSAFGFAEPPDVGGRFPWYIPLGIVGVALIVVAVLLRVWVRRRKAA